MASKTLPLPETRRNKVAVAPATTRPPAGRWSIDAAQSTLQISVKVGFIATVTGRFTDVTGHVDLAANLADSQIAVEVMTSSLTSGSSHWDSVLMNAGLVDTKKNPTISFEAIGISERAGGWQLDGVLVTERGCLEVTFEMHCLGDTGNRIRFRATGTIASRDAVRLLSQPGVDKLIGKSMGIDLVIEAVRD